ncbi:MAG TPA: HigA family addiction module antitoxin [Candidatus Saccharimonadales bacterium]|nr:HigA family addiction module antitoxin [Candidatus Saccharimonadales bacterium]
MALARIRDRTSDLQITRSTNPPHPGVVVRNEIIAAHNLTVTAAAKVLGVSRQALSNLLNGQADLTGDMALRIEKAFGPKMETLMGMQSAYNIFQTRRHERKIKVRPYRPVEAH